MRLQVFGYVHSMTGPSMHAREFCKALGSTDAEVSLKTHFPYSQQWIVEPELQRLIEKPFYQDDPTIILEDANTWRLHLARKPKALVGSIIHEGDSIPYLYADLIAEEGMDQVWTCSEHSAEAIKQGMKRFDKTLPKNKLKIVPHGYNPIFYHPQGEKYRFGRFDDYFTFLYVGGWSQGTRDRKGLDLLYQAFTKEFKKEEKVRLVAKVTGVYNAPGYDPVAELQKIYNAQEAAPVLVISQDFPNMHDLATIYRCADVFVTPSKAEGFSIPTLEALACGLPVISNDYGGQTDFLTKDNSWLLKKGKLDWATDANKPLYDWTKWKTPDVDELRAQLRYCYEHRDEVKAKAEAAYPSIKDWTWGNSATIAIEHLKSLGLE